MRFLSKFIVFSSLIFFTLLYIGGLPAVAQSEGNFRLSAIADRVTFPDSYSQNYGLFAEIYIADHISLGYQFSLGANSRTRQLSAHLPIGTWAASYPFRIYVDTDENLFLYLAVLSFIVPESINFHVHVSDSFHISPFISPLGADYRRVDDRDYVEGMFSAGLRLNVFRENFSLAPFAGVRKLYVRETDWGMLGGFMLGISF